MSFISPCCSQVFTFPPPSVTSNESLITYDGSHMPQSDWSSYTAQPYSVPTATLASPSQSPFVQHNISSLPRNTLSSPIDGLGRVNHPVGQRSGLGDPRTSHRHDLNDGQASSSSSHHRVYRDERNGSFPSNQRQMRFSCSCGKTYNQQAGLSRHLNPGEHRCGFCGSSFNRADTKIRHQRTCRQNPNRSDDS